MVKSCEAKLRTNPPLCRCPRPQGRGCSELRGPGGGDDGDDDGRGPGGRGR